MSETKGEKWLDELISRTIDSGQPQFDPAAWKQKFPQEFQILKSRGSEALAPRSNAWRTIMKSRTTRIAAAGVIIAAIGFLVAYPGPRERPGASEISEVTKSPGEMLTVMSLNIAYRKGGMSAVEKQYDKAFEMLGPRSTSISVKELLAEFNGS